jgi:hypothetical protein
MREAFVKKTIKSWLEEAKGFADLDDICPILDPEDEGDPVMEVYDHIAEVAGDLGIEITEEQGGFYVG